MNILTAQQTTQSQTDSKTFQNLSVKNGRTVETLNLAVHAAGNGGRMAFAGIKTTAAAYGSALVLIGVIIPFVASVTMVGLYLARPQVALFAFDPASKWFALLSSGVITGIVWLLAAFVCSFFTSAQAANSRSYSLLKSRLCQLKARLGLMEADSESDRLLQECRDIKAAVTILKLLKPLDGEDKHYVDNHSAWADALACYIDISKMLYLYPVGVLWVLGAGYCSLWRLLHHAEEALIEVENTGEIVRGAIHDKLAIQGSTISAKDELLDKLMQAVAVLRPESLVYFKEHQPDKGDVALNQLLEALKQKAVKQLMDANGLNTFQDDQSKVNPGQPQELARVALREVRRTLNDFRDKSWEGIVHARNRLLGSIVATGIVTHILLAIAILTSGDNTSGVMAATAFYLIGAVTGLFGRFYRESVSGTSLDDFGFSTARLVATPLLSGLAGIGGVMVTVMLTSLGNGDNGTLSNIFHMNLQFFFAAAIFGLAPNLLIKGLQEKADKYESDIQSSKATAVDTEK